MTTALAFPKSKRQIHLHVAGYAIIAVGVGMIAAGQWFAEGPLATLLPVFAVIDLILGAAMIAYRREVVVDLRTHMVTLRRCILFPVREQKFIPGAFNQVELRGSARGGYSVYLTGNRILFVDGPVALDQARMWAEELSEGTGWKTLENREEEGPWSAGD